MQQTIKLFIRQNSARRFPLSSRIHDLDSDLSSKGFRTGRIITSDRYDHIWALTLELIAL